LRPGEHAPHRRPITPLRALPEGIRWPPYRPTIR
jgi:hypothetical protein